MLIQSLRRSLRRQEGQALVLACLCVLALSIAVITTANLGHAVHERIRLQNNADAAAYSMAAMEARAFNFYAFTNRAEASHYVSAMQWQSLLSFMFFMEAFFTDVTGVISTFAPCASPTGKWRILCPILEAIPYVGVVIRIISRIVQAVQQAVRALQTGFFKPIAGPADGIVGKLIIPAHRTLNKVLSAAALTVMESSLSHVQQMSKDVIVDNDTNVDPMWGAAIAGVLSGCMYDRAHNKDVLGSPYSPKSLFSDRSARLKLNDRSENSKENRAKRTMAQISNATRYGCKGMDPRSCGLLPEDFVTNRGLGSIFGFLPDGVQDFLDGLPKWGQTKLLGFGQAEGQSQNFIHRSGRSLPANQNYGPLASGDNIGSDDIYKIEIDIGDIGSWGEENIGNGNSDQKFRRALRTSIWALNDEESASRRWRGGIHWRLQYDQPNTSCRTAACGFRRPSGYGFDRSNLKYKMGLNKTKPCALKVFGVCVLKVEKYSANIQRVWDQNHPWNGMIRFPHFEPGQYANQCPSFGGTASLNSPATRQAEFNQPSTWVLLNKTPEQMKNPNADDNGVTHNTPSQLNDQSKISFAFGAGAGTELVLDDSRKRFGMGIFSTEGINAIARGQAYYHRPGNWAEQPNFFNPFWRPRLASVYQGSRNIRLLDPILNALPGPTQSIPQKIITH